MNIAGQIAVVTGGGSGFGRAMAMGLAREGAKIFIMEVRRPEGEKVVEEIHALGGTAELSVGDVSHADFVRQAIGFCVERFRRIDILINNAGLRMETHAHDGYEPWRCLVKKSVHELSIEDWDLVLKVNLRGVFLCTHFALPYMIEQRSGAIISISSTAGSRGVAGKSAYCASKHGVEGLMKAVAEETRAYGINANAVHPGGGLNSLPGKDPNMIVPLILYLADRDRRDITGQTISALEWNRERAAHSG